MSEYEYRYFTNLLLGQNFNFVPNSENAYNLDLGFSGNSQDQNYFDMEIYANEKDIQPFYTNQQIYEYEIQYEPRDVKEVVYELAYEVAYEMQKPLIRCGDDLRDFVLWCLGVFNLTIQIEYLKGVDWSGVNKCIINALNYREICFDAVESTETSPIQNDINRVNDAIDNIKICLRTHRGKKLRQINCKKRIIIEFLIQRLRKDHIFKELFIKQIIFFVLDDNFPRGFIVSKHVDQAVRKIVQCSGLWRQYEAISPFSTSTNSCRNLRETAGNKKLQKIIDQLKLSCGLGNIQNDLVCLENFENQDQPQSQSQKLKTVTTSARMVKIIGDDLDVMYGAYFRDNDLVDCMQLEKQEKENLKTRKKRVVEKRYPKKKPVI